MSAVSSNEEFPKNEVFENWKKVALIWHTYKNIKIHKKNKRVIPI